MRPSHVLGPVSVKLARSCTCIAHTDTGQGAMNYLHRFLVVSNGSQYFSLVGFMELMVILVLANVSLVLSQNVTSFHFQTFNTTDADLSEFLIQGDAALVTNASTSSVWLNLNSEGNSTCGSLFYANQVQFRHWSPAIAMPAVASFQTSFTFAISGENSGGFAFLLSPANSTRSSSSGGSMCLMSPTQNGDPSNHILAVEFDTWKNPEFGDPSDNHVGVNVNSTNSTATFNFCGDGVEECDYFVTERDFTAWVDYDPEQRTLEVRVAEGGDDGVAKPEPATVQVAELDISAVVKDYMWVGFSGSQSLHQEILKIKAWRFATGPFRNGYTEHAHGRIPRTVEMVVGVAVVLASLIAVAVVVHRVLHGKWGCISCDHSEVRVMPAKQGASDGIERA